MVLCVTKTVGFCNAKEQKNMEKTTNLAKLLLVLIVFCLSSGLVWADNSPVILQISNNDEIAGNIAIELFPDDAPVTVENFLKYVNDGFYDGLVFHRVINGFIIQAGAFYPDLSYNTPTYPNIINESANGLSNLRGTLAMARIYAADSASSQFFINQDDNIGLDRAYAYDGVGYCVLGKVIDGMDLVDAIAETPTDLAWFPYYNSLMNYVPQTPVVIEQAYVRIFTADSCDLSDVPFLCAKPGEVRTYRGQGGLTRHGYVQRASYQQMLGVNCLRIDESYNPRINEESFCILAARDTRGNCWIFMLVENGQVQFKAQSLQQIIPFSTMDNSYFSLMTENYDQDEHVLPNLSAEAAEKFEDFEGETVLVIDVDDDDTETGQSYYNETMGLVLKVLDSTGDLDGDGWFLDQQPTAITISKSSFKAGKTAQSDSFSVAGIVDDLPTDEQAEPADFLSLRVGPYTVDIDLEADGWKDSDTSHSYKGSTDGTDQLTFNVSTKKNTFSIAGKKVDLFGLSYPIAVEIAIGDYHAMGLVPEQGKALPITFLSGYGDFMRVMAKNVKLKLDKKGRENADSLTVQGELALEDGFVNLNEQEVTVYWGETYGDSIPIGGLIRKGPGNKYTYKKAKDFGGTISSALFDLDKGIFKIVVKNASLGPEPDGAVEFTLQIGDFMQIVPVEL